LAVDKPREREMERSFTTRRGTTRILFGRASIGRLAAAIDAIDTAPLPLSKILVLSTPGRRDDAAALAARLGSRSVGTLSIAREHVPISTVVEAQAVAEQSKADALLAFGGGSAIGLAKAVVMSTSAGLTGLRIIAVPTTYSGSEVTPVFGVTESGKKRIGRDERARPSLVIYDPQLTDGLPRDVTMTSLWNAMAHAVEALWLPSTDHDRATRLVAEEAVRLLSRSMRRLAAKLDDREARDDALEAAYLAGGVFADVGGGLHHKLCHVLGGAFDLPHASTHAALLPHVVRWMAACEQARGLDAMAALSRALGAVDPARALDHLAVTTGVPRSLDELGFSRAKDDSAARAVIDAVLAAPPSSVRPLDRVGLDALLAAAAAPAPAARRHKPLRVPDAESSKLQPGFGSTHDSEVLSGALPRTQNAPRPAPYGLYPELLSGTPFTVKNALNSRVWMYRVRPSFSHAAFRALPMGPFGDVLTDVDPNRTRWAPLPIPEAPARVDFLDGLVTLGGDGDTRGPGYVVSLYAANTDMVDRAFSTADGDVLIVPQSGTLDVRTELGFLRVPPGFILLIPRAIKFAVGLPDGAARGWMCEVFGPRFRLPERGPIGSNGLADARHFLAPTASYEDRLCPGGFEVVHKLGGRLWSAMQEQSPFDVVAWHGVHVPVVYDLMHFNAMGSVTFDHVDPSIHTVLTAPLDDQGRAVVDFVVFRGRWDVAEHSFRPPFMHRNAASEINCVVKATSVDSGYAEGCTFVSPLLTSHGITTRSYDAVLDMPDAEHEGPRRLPDSSLWVMFESALPFRPTPWARATPDPHFLTHFEGMRSRFTP
jgi:homogentisate 1,2-dioxygenase